MERLRGTGKVFLRTFVAIVFLSVSTPFVASAGFEIIEKVDKFKGWTGIWMEDAKKIDIEDFADWSEPIELLAMKGIAVDGETSYLLCVYYYSSDWLFIEDGVSLLLMVDGELFEFATAWRPSTDVASGGYVREYAYYDVEPEFLWKISNAEEIEVRVKGKYSLDGKFKDELFEQFKEFCEYCGITEGYVAEE